VYPLSAALSRPLIAKHLVAAARQARRHRGGHGATGKGNDQVRFDLAVKGMAPELKILALSASGTSPATRRWNTPRSTASRCPPPRSLHSPSTRTSGAAPSRAECSRTRPGAARSGLAWTRSADAAPAAPAYLKIGFEAGLPVTVNGEKLKPAALISKVGEIAGLHGVGRIDLMEDRVVGIKSRETYECPASVALIAAHQEVERFTVMGDALRVKGQLDQRSRSSPTRASGSARSVSRCRLSTMRWQGPSTAR